MFKPNSTKLFVASQISRLRNCIIERNKARKFASEHPDYSYMVASTLDNRNIDIREIRNSIEHIKTYKDYIGIT